MTIRQRVVLYLFALLLGLVWSLALGLRDERSERLHPEPEFIEVQR